MKSDPCFSFKLLHERKQWRIERDAHLRLSDDKLTPGMLEAKMNNSKISTKLKTAAIFKTFPFFKPKSDKEIKVPKYVGEVYKFKEKKLVKASRISASNCSFSDDFSIKKLTTQHTYQNKKSELSSAHPLARKLNTYFGCKREPSLVTPKPSVQFESRSFFKPEPNKNSSLLSINSETLLLNQRYTDPKPIKQKTKLRSKSVNSGKVVLKREPEKGEERLQGRVIEHFSLKRVLKQKESPATLSPKNLTLQIKKQCSSAQPRQTVVKNFENTKTLVPNVRSSPTSHLQKFPLIDKSEYDKIANDRELLGPEKIQLILGLVEQSQPEASDETGENDEVPCKSLLHQKKENEAKNAQFLASLEEIKEDEKEDDDFEMTLRNNLNKKTLMNNSAASTRKKFGLLNSFNKTRFY